eukprot:CAMPEP_0181287910 /NCGR_PEP_ID=MMETSP1101-20121128/45_1 /TAXON_ID=46948 /ORGANISM="Rhodomonas abbreviata, Strain Caron Lab Isolate" /LENGTH=83 /DNA_ID=CAMNT_0023391985 /DNA_START=224 /DNA_END=475 /DNA_ORIENTATION=-
MIESSSRVGPEANPTTEAAFCNGGTNTFSYQFADVPAVMSFPKWSDAATKTLENNCFWPESGYTSQCSKQLLIPSAARFCACK